MNQLTFGVRTEEDVLPGEGLVLREVLSADDDIHISVPLLDLIRPLIFPLSSFKQTKQVTISILE